MLFLAIVAPIGAMLVQMAVSRSREFLADETGAAATAFIERALVWYRAQKITVERIMSEEGLPPREATRKAMTEVSSAVVAIGLLGVKLDSSAGKHGNALGTSSGGSTGRIGTTAMSVAWIPGASFG